MLLARALADIISPSSNHQIFICGNLELSVHEQAMPPTEEDLAWFRSTFHPIPKPRLPDDCVEYCLYIFDSSLDPANESEVRLRLREVQKHASDLQKEWLKDYVWQRQGLGLELMKEDGEVCGVKLRAS
jgi:hypothetical protein